jgi:hypothetical protein
MSTATALARKGTTRMTTHAYAASPAIQANGSAGAARVRAFRPCPASPAVSPWSPTMLGAITVKHGRPRRTEVSHP